MRKVALAFLSLFLTMTSTTFVTAATNQKIVVAKNFKQVQLLVDAATSAEVIKVVSGTYLDNSLNINKDGISVVAQVPGRVILNGFDSITISGNNDRFSGFQFLAGGSPKFAITVLGNNAYLSDLNFNGYAAQKYVVFKNSATYGVLMNSNFENKPIGAPLGDLIQIDPGPDSPNYVTISNNSCQHLPGAGGDNGNECIRIGEGALSKFVSRTVVEYNYFEDTGPGDSEAISIKSQENVIRYNTMFNNPGAMFVFRNGDNNQMYGNYFVLSGGVRVKQAANAYIFNNIFDRAGTTGKMPAFLVDQVKTPQSFYLFGNTFVDSIGEPAGNDITDQPLPIYAGIKLNNKSLSKPLLTADVGPSYLKHRKVTK
jgi:hypothetical protein